MLNFKEDTMTTASRSSLRAVSRKLGFNETQTVLYALARLRDEVLTGEDIKPLTQAHHRAIAKAAPRGQGKVIGSLLTPTESTE